MNRAIAVGMGEGPERGLFELQSISRSERLRDYTFFAAARGEFELRCGRCQIAREHFGVALTAALRRFLELRVAVCGENAETPTIRNAEIGKS